MYNPMMPKAWISLFVLPLFITFTPALHEVMPTSPVATQACSIDNNTFQAGEEITYKLYYNWNFVWLSAGEVTFRVKELGNEYHFSARGRTYKSYEWFYRVNDKYDTYANKETLLPRLSIRDIEEGGYRRYDRVSIDQKNRKAVSLRGKTRDEAEEENFSLSNCMHDILSIIYYTRNLNFNDMRVNQEIPVKIFFDREEHPLKVRYLGTEDRKKVKGQGRYDTHVFSPQVIAGDVFKADDQMKVWVSNDQNRIPVLIESPVSVGSVKCVLESYKGLKYPLTAESN